MFLFTLQTISLFMENMDVYTHCDNGTSEENENFLDIFLELLIEILRFD